MLEKNAYYHAFNLLNGCGPGMVQKLLAKCGQDIALAWNQFPSLTKRTDLINSWSQINPEKQWQTLKSLKIKTVSLKQAEYPALLREVVHAPFILYLYGRLAIPKHSLTVVGTRKMTAYGQQAAKAILIPLAQAGVGLISGLAFGVDAEAHEIAIDHGAYTLAVLGSGLKCLTPTAHVGLARRIIKSGGGIISEFPPFMPAKEGHFPRRNRTLAGLTPTTLVIEAGSISGTAITAREALEANRQVAAVPGPIFAPTSHGCLDLLKKGAMPVSCAQDLFPDLFPAVDLGGSTGTHAPLPKLTPQEEQLFQALDYQPKDIDAISAATRIQATKLLPLITSLEMLGIIQRMPGRGYCRKIR